MTDQALQPLHSETLYAVPGILHGFYTRHGGVSTGPLASLNVSYAQDTFDNVTENRLRVTRHLSSTSSPTTPQTPIDQLNMPSTSIGAIPLYLPRLCHTSDVIKLDDPHTTQTAQLISTLHADAIITTHRNIAIGIYTADCAPVLLCDTSAGVIAAMHVGWKGLVNGIVEHTVTAMVETKGACVENITAAIGPCIKQLNYEVGPEFEERFVGIDQENQRFFCRVQGRDRPFFDLAGCTARRLEKNGVSVCDVMATCTMEDERFFSYRRNVKSGVNGFGCQASVIMLT